MRFRRAPTSMLFRVQGAPRTRKRQMEVNWKIEQCEIGLVAEVFRMYLETGESCYREINYNTIRRSSILHVAPEPINIAQRIQRHVKDFKRCKGALVVFIRSGTLLINHESGKVSQKILLCRSGTSLEIYLTCDLTHTYVTLLSLAEESTMCECGF